MQLTDSNPDPRKAEELESPEGRRQRSAICFSNCKDLTSFCDHAVRDGPKEGQSEQ